MLHDVSCQCVCLFIWAGVAHTVQLVSAAGGVASALGPLSVLPVDERRVTSAYKIGPLELEVSPLDFCVVSRIATRDL